VRYGAVRQGKAARGHGDPAPFPFGDDKRASRIVAAWARARHLPKERLAK
jgi:hypothetical protein